MQCECCTLDKNVNNVLVKNDTIKMAICIKCLMKIERYEIPESLLEYIHNCYLSGQRKQFIK